MSRSRVCRFPSGETGRRSSSLSEIPRQGGRPAAQSGAVVVQEVADHPLQHVRASSVPQTARHDLRFGIDHAREELCGNCNRAQGPATMPQRWLRKTARVFQNLHDRPYKTGQLSAVHCAMIASDEQARDRANDDRVVANNRLRMRGTECHIQEKSM
jgi:hypothetical protein